jgi:hypothetical protein
LSYGRDRFFLPKHRGGPRPRASSAMALVAAQFFRSRSSFWPNKEQLSKKESRPGRVMSSRAAQSSSASCFPRIMCLRLPVTSHTPCSSAPSWWLAARSPLGSASAAAVTLAISLTGGQGRSSHLTPRLQPAGPRPAVAPRLGAVPAPAGGPRQLSTMIL